MSRGDIQVIGVSAGAHPFRVAASATRGYAGEPINSLAARTAGAADVNTVVVLTDAKPVIGTDNFIGIAEKNMKVDSTGTVVAQKLGVVVPIPNVTRMRGKAKTAANVDTDAELLAILHDEVLFDLTSGVYTIDDTAAANTSGLEIVDGIPSKGTLDVVVDARAMRKEVA